MKKSESRTSSLRQEDILKNVTSLNVGELSTYRTESIGVVNDLFYLEKPDNCSNPLQEPPSNPDQSCIMFKPDNISTLLQESSIYLERSNRWIKRLRHNPLDSLALATKRFKTQDASNRYLQVHKRVDNTSLLTKNSHCIFGESKAINCWIGRWCHHSRRLSSRSKLPATVLCEPESSKSMHRILEINQIPSIPAMALMGKAAKKFCPQFRRRGSLQIWSM